MSRSSSSHRRPDVDEHEIDRALHIHEGFPEIPLAELDWIGQAGFCKMPARYPGLLRLTLGADHDWTAASVELRHVREIVANRSSKKERRDAE